MSRKKNPLKSLARLVWLAAGVAGAYWYWVRPWHRKWGAAQNEADRIFPSDELLPGACYSATHALTVFGSVEQVWPWIIQMGAGRAGFYSYDFIENSMGQDIHSASRIRPELQNLKVGDVVRLGPHNFGLRVATLEPHHMLALHGDSRLGEISLPDLKPGEYLAMTWTFLLEPINSQTTRLLERLRLDYTPTVHSAVLYRAFVEPGSFLMERRMLLGIKSRAEGRRLG